MQTLIWKSLDGQSQEYFKLFYQNNRHILQGTIVTFAISPMLINYKIECDRDWFTRHVLVYKEVSDKTYDLELYINEEQVWLNRKSMMPLLTGLLDVDFEFSPSTNTLPIRRLNLAVGESRIVEAAWVRFEELKLERLVQKYSRIGDRQYLYENPSTGFRSVLEVDKSGLIIRYGDLWYRLN